MFGIIVLNLGGTSSKIAYYQSKQLIKEKTLRHTEEDALRLNTAELELDYRYDLVTTWLDGEGISLDTISAIAVRGATIPQASRSGTYLLNDYYKELAMELYLPEELLVNGIRISVPLALRLVGNRNIPIYITDPPSVNEMQPIASLSGLAEYPRRGRFHALNQRAVARKHAEALGKTLEDCNFIVAHLGGGISVGAHSGGKVIDANDAGDGYGPFSPDRAGTVSTEAMYDLFYHRSMPYKEIYQHVRKEGGVFSHLGTTDMRAVEQGYQANKAKPALVFEAMAYQIAKEICSNVAVLKGDVDGILLTGGIANSAAMCTLIEERVSSVAPVTRYPGEFENEALALGAYRVLSEEEAPILLEKEES